MNARMHRSSRRIIPTQFPRVAAAAIIMGAGALSPGMLGQAHAHDAVLQSTPAAGATIEQAPEAIVLEFSGEPQEGFNSVALSVDGTVVANGEPTAEGATLTFPIDDPAALPPGEYTVGYQITSSDGHVTRDSYVFTLTGTDSTVETTAASTTEQSTSPASTANNSTNAGENPAGATTVPSWLLPLGSIVVIAAALVMAIMRWRQLPKQ